jgi:hypothetical protein
MPSDTNLKTVDLYGLSVQHEAEALGDITPGMLIERAEGGVQAHSGGVVSTHFAIEFGSTGRAIDDQYEEGDQVLFRTFLPGAGVNALLDDGENASEGDFLSSAGDGSLKVAEVDDIAVAQALESVDNSAGEDPVRIRVEVIAPQTVPAAS